MKHDNNIRMPGHPMRAHVLSLWIGSMLGPCALAYRDAVRVSGLVERIAHDTGLRYSDTEVRAALALEGIEVHDGGRLAKTFASTLTARARGSFAALIQAVSNGGK